MKKILILNKKAFLFVLTNQKFYIFYFIFFNKKIILIIYKHIFINKNFLNFFFLNNNLNNLNNLNNFFYSWNKFFFKKIKVRHKISWLKIFRKKYYTLRINFGFSFNIILNLNELFIKKKKKYMTYSSILFWSLNNKRMYNILNFLKNFQSINSYTSRGFRFSQQKFIKRIGKVSKFMDFKTKLL